MYKSGLLNGLPRNNQTDINLNETRNGFPSGFLSPKITSTPLVTSKRESPTVTPTRLNLSKKYSLSDVSATPPPSRPSLISKYNTSPSVSTTRPVNDATLIETKSPGYVSRIVQYNEERNNLATHQPKYGRPGVFPIVHLYKKDPPLIKPKPSKVTVRLGSSGDLSKYNSPEHNRMLLEKIVQSSPKNRSTEVSTRSVLDALKEISRKRIHANEDNFDMKDLTGKRPRKDCINGGEASTSSSKRLRDEECSPIQTQNDSSSNEIKNNNKKRFCTIDELFASESSTSGVIVGIKRKASPSPPKQVKLINAETQTILPQVKSTATEPEIQHEEPITIKTPVKARALVFEDKCLETVRKDRLNVLMSSFSRKKNNEDNNSQIKETKPLVSILAGTNKPVHNKHVHFNIPETTSQITRPTEITTTTNVLTTRTSIAETTSIISNKENMAAPTPLPSPELKVPSTSTSTFNFGTEKTSPNITTTALPPAFSLINSTSQISTTVSTATTNASSASLLGVASTKSEISTTSNTIPTFSFGSPKSNLELPKSLSENPKSIGGFKFDLNKPRGGLDTTITTSSLNFGIPKTSEIKVSSPSFNFGADKKETTVTTVSSTPPTFSFGSNLVTTSSNVGFNTTTTSNLINFNTPVTTKPSIINFDSNNFGNTSLVTTSTFAGINTITTTVSALSSQSGGKPMFSFGDSTTTTAPTLNFGSTTTSIPLFGSTTTSSLITTTAIPFNSTKSSLFESVTSAPNFSTAPTFGSTTSTITFGKASSSFGSTTSSGTLDKSSLPVFGVSTTAGNFGATTTSTPSFGSTTAPMFNNVTTAAPAFGNNTVTTTSLTFGTTTSSASTFGNVNAPGFGNSFKLTFDATTTSTPNTKPTIFGSASTPITTTTATTIGNSSFGITTPNFGTKTNSVFGNTTTTAAPLFSANVPSFGTTSPSFGNTSFGSNAPPTFGATVTTTTTSTNATPSFGTSTTSFGNNNATFGATTTASFNFGNTTTALPFGTATTQQNMFGTAAAPTTTAPSSGFSFGQSTVTTTASSTFSGFGSTSGFNSAPTFGATTTSTTTPTFGASVPSFGLTFGQTNNNTTTTTAGVVFGTNTPTFGSTNTFGSGGFNSNSTTSAFAKSQQNTFGSLSNSFGNNFVTTPQQNGFGTTPVAIATTTTTTAGQNSVFTFGAATTKPSVFSFGGGGEPPKPSFNFTNNSGTPTFGATQTPGPSFGVTAPPTFAAIPTPQFGAQQPGGGAMFNIGTGSTTPTGRARTQLKAKRRT